MWYRLWWIWRKWASLQNCFIFVSRQPFLCSLNHLLRHYYADAGLTFVHFHYWWVKEPDTGNISDHNSWFFQNSTLADRMASYDTSPGTSLGFHWLFGMLFIFYFYTFFLFTKEVLRPGLSKLHIISHHNLWLKSSYRLLISILSLVYGELKWSRIQSTQRNDVHAHYQLCKVSLNTSRPNSFGLKIS